MDFANVPFGVGVHNIPAALFAFEQCEICWPAGRLGRRFIFAGAGRFCLFGHGFGFIDSLGALGLIYFSYNEGKEAFEKAAGMECSCGDDHCEA